jgi:hypothetical protein
MSVTEILKGVSFKSALGFMALMWGPFIVARVTGMDEYGLVIILLMVILVMLCVALHTLHSEMSRLRYEVWQLQTQVPDQLYADLVKVLDDKDVSTKANRKHSVPQTGLS